MNIWMDNWCQHCSYVLARKKKKQYLVIITETAMHIRMITDVNDSNKPGELLTIKSYSSQQISS